CRLRRCCGRCAGADPPGHPAAGGALARAPRARGDRRPQCARALDGRRAAAALSPGAPMKLTGIGALRERLALQSASRAADGGGGATVTWSTVADVWAAVRPISGDERLRHDAVTARVTHEVWIRHRSDVAPAMRFTS